MRKHKPFMKKHTPMWIAKRLTKSAFKPCFTRTGLLTGSITACLMASSARADVITFEDLNNNVIPVPAAYAGFNWEGSAMTIGKQLHPKSGYDYGTMGEVSMWTYQWNPVVITGKKFNFKGAYITAAWDSREDVIVEGWRNGEKIYNRTITTHNDKAYWFDFDFQNIDRLKFTPIGNQIDIDNITYDEQFNAAPIANNDKPAISEDSGANTLNVLSNDSDANNDTLTITSVTQGGKGNVAISGDGKSVIYTPKANENGSDSFTYTISDGKGGTATGTVDISITSVNDAPLLGAITATPTEINEGSSTSLSGSFSDVDAADTHTVTINWGDGSTPTILNLAAGVENFSNISHTYDDDNLSGTSSDVYPVSITVTDNHGAQDSTSKPFYESAAMGNANSGGGYSLHSNQFLGVRFQVTSKVTISRIGGHIGGGGQVFGALVRLSGPNDLPDSLNLTTPDVIGTTLLTLGGFPDVSSPLVQQLEPGWYALVFGSGLFGATGSGFMPGNNPEIGVPSYIHSVNNGFINSGNRGVRFTVIEGNPVAITLNNVAPTAVFANGGAVDEGSTGTVSFAEQADPSAADKAGLRYAYDFNNDNDFADAGEIGNGGYAGSSTSPTATVPAAYLSTPGTRTVRGRIMDDDGGFTDYTTTITVKAVNKAPVANAGVDKTLEYFIKGGEATLDGTASSDPDGDTLTYSWSKDGNVIGTAKTFRLLLPLGVHTFTLTVTDSKGASHSDMVVITVKDTMVPIVEVKGADNNWHNQSVTLKIEGDDRGTGVNYLEYKVGDADWTKGDKVTIGAPADHSNDGAHTVTVRAVDNVGLISQERKVVVKIDTIAPTVTPADVTDPNWHNSELSHNFEASDAGSGLANAADANFTLTASEESASAVAPTVVSKTVTDAAGNSTTRKLSALIDKTKPTLKWGALPEANSNGWYKQDVTVDYTAADALSGLAEGHDSGSVVISAESKSSTGAVTVTDLAGNSQLFTTEPTIQLDKTAPLAKAKNLTVYLSETAPAKVSISAANVDDGSADALSGIASLSFKGITGDVTFDCTNLNLKDLGKNNVTLVVTDNAGNSSEAQATVTVLDETAPTVTAVAATNAGGRPLPANSGYFQLSATDNDTCNADDLLINVYDSDGTLVAEGLKSGAIVKITHTPGSPAGVRYLTGAVAAHINVQGDASVGATDASGNDSTRLTFSAKLGGKK
jgi:hypothetical protein